MVKFVNEFAHLQRLWTVTPVCTPGGPPCTSACRKCGHSCPIVYGPLWPLLAPRCSGWRLSSQNDPQGK